MVKVVRMTWFVVTHPVEFIEDGPWWAIWALGVPLGALFGALSW